MILVRNCNSTTVLKANDLRKRQLLWLCDLLSGSRHFLGEFWHGPEWCKNGVMMML